MAESTRCLPSQLRETVHTCISQWAQATPCTFLSVVMAGACWPRPAPASQPVPSLRSMQLLIRGCTCPVDVLLPLAASLLCSPLQGTRQTSLWLQVGRQRSDTCSYTGLSLPPVVVNQEGSVTGTWSSVTYLTLLCLHHINTSLPGMPCPQEPHCLTCPKAAWEKQGWTPAPPCDPCPWAGVSASLTSAFPPGEGPCMVPGAGAWL